MRKLSISLSDRLIGWGDAIGTGVGAGDGVGVGFGVGLGVGVGFGVGDGVVDAVTIGDGEGDSISGLSTIDRQEERAALIAKQKIRNSIILFILQGLPLIIGFGQK